MGAAAAWVVCLGLMVTGTILSNTTIQNWALVASALAATLTVGAFATRQTQAIQNTAMVANDAREQGLIPMQRRPR